MIETNRLRIRQWVDSDYTNFKKIFSDPRTSQFIGGELNEEDAWRLMASYVGHFQLKGFSYCAVELKFDKTFLGSVGLWNSDPWPEMELGYWLLEEAQGKGYATEACYALLNFAFNDLMVSTLVSYIHPNNLASIKLAKKIGGIYEGEIKLLEFGNHLVYRYQKS